MRDICGTFLGIMAVITLTAGMAFADAKVDEQPLGPDGDSIGCSISPHGNHVGVLAAKGSRFVVLLDRVEGPKIEGLMPAIYGNLYQAGTYWQGQVPILFSNDGSHSAYIAKMGDDYVVFEDGKEIYRGPESVSNGSNINVPLEFTNGGKHLIFLVVGDDGKFHVVVDGKPGPASGEPPWGLIVSNDGEHYAYTGVQNANDSPDNPHWAVVDGRQVNYFGDNMQYTGKNIILTTMAVDGGTGLLINGKPSIKAQAITPMWLSPDGNEIAMEITPNNTDPRILVVNGKEIPDATGLNVNKMYFSPDGKRWAALVQTKTGASFMIIDGTKGEEYQTISPDCGVANELRMRWNWMNGKDPASNADVTPPVPGFTADSSKFVYVASEGGRQFMVVDSDESDPFKTDLPLQPVLSPVGNRIAVIGNTTDGHQRVIVDGDTKIFGPAQSSSGPSRCYCFSFTPDGTRYAYINGSHLNVDGVNMPGASTGMQYVFSPDDKHIAYMATDDSVWGLFLDGKIIESSNTTGQTGRVFFSPDSQHIYTLKHTNLGSMGTKDSELLSVDGKPVTHFDWAINGSTCNFEFAPDDTMTFVALTDGNLRLFKVTPSADENITTLLATAKTPTGN